MAKDFSAHIPVQPVTKMKFNYLKNYLNLPSMDHLVNILMESFIAKNKINTDDLIKKRRFK